MEKSIDLTEYEVSVTILDEMFSHTNKKSAPIFFTDHFLGTRELM